MLDVEQAIREVGAVYQALTGRPIEPSRSEMPPNVDVSAHVEGRYRQFKTMIDTAPRGPGAMPFLPVWAPPLEVIEHDQEVRYELDLPAISRDQIGISVIGDSLVVRGMRAVVPAPGAAVRYSERPTGAFQRVISLPARARRDGIQAAQKDGVLIITVPTDGPSGSPLPVDVK